MKRKTETAGTQIPLSPRSGAALVESAIVLPVMLVIVLSMLDFGLAILNHNSLSEAARWTAREAIVRGEHATPDRPEWGPESYSGTAADSTEQGAVVRKGLSAIDANEVDVLIEWPDGDNNVGQRVRVTLTHQYKPMVPFTFLENLYTLSAISTMRITH